MVSRNRTTGVEIQSIRYPVKTEEGNEYTVSIDPCDESTICTCKAGENGRDCWHAKMVRAIRSNRVGRPVYRVTQRPPATRARTSPEGLAFAASLDVG
jgi:hypothetical protein